MLAHRLFLGLTVLVTAIALRDAWGDADRLLFYLPAVGYGVLLEQATLAFFDAYRYPTAHYLLVVGDVPVVIGVCWGAILYAGWRLGRNHARSVLPAFVGLFALHVDFAMDAVAVRLDFWRWLTPNPLWFGVPLGNMYGWFWVAVLYAGLWTLLHDRWRWLAVLAPLAAPAVLVALLEFWTRYVAPTPAHRLLVLGGLVVGAVWVVTRHAAPVPALGVHRIPLAFHAFFLAWALVGDMPPGVVVAAALFAGVSVAWVGVPPGRLRAAVGTG
ncbi:MAG: carotenoid biosynthesis protein [Halobacteriaceae archaeon]